MVFVAIPNSGDKSDPAPKIGSPDREHLWNRKRSSSLSKGSNPRSPADQKLSSPFPGDAILDSLAQIWGLTTKAFTDQTSIEVSEPQDCVSVL